MGGTFRDDEGDLIVFAWTGGYEDIAIAAQITQSSLDSDEVVIQPVAPLNMADGLYYAVYISSTNEKEIARSDIFTASNNLNAAAEPLDFPTSPAAVTPPRLAPRGR